MEVSPTTPTALRFGSFELDIRSRELRQGDTRIRLQEQPFEILRLMLERPGDVVTRDELRQRLWPEGTFVDFEHSLNAAVKRLRAALGDDADRPRFVETLPRRGYRFIAPLESRAADAAAVSPVPPRIAVLPFNNLSNDPTQDYFSDGLTEELTAQLGPMCRGRIAVIARRSSMVFKGTTQRASEIAAALRARYLLEGSVRRDGQRVRVTVRLIEGETETELWSDTHERTVDDWLSVQADVAAHVARSLLLELAPGYGAASAAPDPRAHRAYLKARYHWALPGDGGLEEALRLLDEALRIAPDFAAAHGALARVTVGAAEYYRRVPLQALCAARESAQRALTLDPANAEARVVLADISRIVDFDWRAAKEAYRDVLASNPSIEHAHRGYASLLAIQGRHADAVRAADVSRELDPLCFVPSLTAAWTRYMAGLYDEAADVCAHTLEMGPTYVPVLRLRSLALLQAGDARRATAELEAGIDAVGRHPQLLTLLAHVYGATGCRDTAAAVMAELRGMQRDRYVSPYQLALAFAGIDELDAAFDALDRAYRDRDPNLAHVVIEPRFALLRSDTRYARLAETLHLTKGTRIA
jgi:TolB-like protein/Tfp pilus assembly protein PilF